MRIRTRLFSQYVKMFYLCSIFILHLKSKSPTWAGEHKELFDRQAGRLVDWLQTFEHLHVQDARGVDGEVQRDADSPRHPPEEGSLRRRIP